MALSPNTWPSLLNSIAGETIELENPVIGTSVPAPAIFAILSYTLNAVKIAANPIKVIDTVARAIFYIHAQHEVSF